uniref:Uncharacterized protein n=1 Tax=Oryza meridionalis TaxID=40149 RepID=A0A0E0EKT5_9ORYZ
MQELEYWTHHHPSKQSNMAPPLARLPPGDLPCDPDSTQNPSSGANAMSQTQHHPGRRRIRSKWMRPKTPKSSSSRSSSYESSSSSSASAAAGQQQPPRGNLGFRCILAPNPSSTLSSSSAAAATKSIERFRRRPSGSGVPISSCGSRFSTMPHFPSGSRVKCTVLAVLCGKVGKQRAPPCPVPGSQRPRPSYPFPELISSGRLEVHTLINPTVDQFLEAQLALQPRFMYLQGQQLDNEEKIGTLVWGDADVSDPQIFSSLIRPPFPTIVAYATFQLYCVRNNEVQRLMLGPHLLGDAPRIYITPPGNEMAEEEDTSEYFPDIKIYDENVNLKLLICGAHCTLDSSLLNSLEDGLNALLNIEFRWCKLQDRVSAAPPLHVDSTLLDGMVTICCDITTSSSSHVSLLLSGSPQTCFDDKLLEKHIKKELIESRRLVRVVLVSEDGPSSAEPLTSMSVASGASTFEVLMTLPKWAAQVLKYLAQETSYKSLVPLGIASVNGTPVCSFDSQDVDWLLFFCTIQDEAIGTSLYPHPPRWSASLAKDRVKGSMVSKPVDLYILSAVVLTC